MHRIEELIERVSKLSKGRLGMRLTGGNPAVSRFMPPHEAGEGDMSFLSDPRYASTFAQSRAALLVLREKDAASVFGETLPERAILFCDDPYAFFAFASQILYPVPRTPGVSPQAWVEEGAEVELITDGVHIHPAMVRFTFNTFGDDHVILIAEDTDCRIALTEDHSHLA